MTIPRTTHGNTIYTIGDCSTVLSNGRSVLAHEQPSASVLVTHPHYLCERGERGHLRDVVVDVTLADCHDYRL